LKTTTTDYAAMLQALSERQREFHETLRGKAEEVLRQFLSCFHTDLREGLVNFDLIYDYAMEIGDADFCRYERMVIDFLARDADFPKYVDIKINVENLSAQDAVTQAFLDCATNSPKGRFKSRAWFFLTHYFNWAMAPKRRNLSLDLFLEEHAEDLDTWCEHNGLSSVDDDFRSGRGIEEIGRSVKRFVTGPCGNDLERAIALRLGLNGFNGSHECTSEVVRGLMEHGYGIGKTERTLRNVVDWVMKRIAAWFVVDDLASRIHEETVEIYGRIEATRGWFMRFAEVSSLEEAKRVAETDLKQREREPKSNTGRGNAVDLDAIECHYRANDILTKRRQWGEGEVLELWCSVTTGEKRRGAATYVYSNGGYDDFAAGQTGRARELVS